MSAAPLVSVLVPAFQAGVGLRAAVESVLAGGLEPERLEILVEADDGRSYPEVLGLPGVRLQTTGAVGSGVGPARNRALARARGAFIACLDADDLLAPGWLAALIPLAQRAGAAVSALEVEEDGNIILRLWQDRDRLGFADLAQSGASLRGLVARAHCPPFADAPSQDILHGLTVMARLGGSLPLSPLPYRLRLRPASVSAAADFPARVHAAYLAHVATLEGDPSLSPAMARAAADVFRAKIALNAAFVAEGAGRSYYRFIADRLSG